MTITPTDVHKLLRGILYPIDLSGGSSSASSAHLDSDWSDGASVRTNVTASTTASSSAASQGTPGQSAKFSRFLAPPARTGKKARPPRAQVRPSADSAMLAEHTKNVLKLEGSQFESLKRNIVETHSTQATALDITIYLFLLERNLGFWRPDDLPGPTVYGEWKQLERSDIQKMHFLMTPS
ncbi:hypothetical protein BC832DRAFT_222582 [Gaertneriomyces semiglobifer]|nr:hypothetical protein BC832DRAFT_222582 [Gaertneriomyces semiglobifer]